MRGREWQGLRGIKRSASLPLYIKENIRLKSIDPRSLKSVRINRAAEELAYMPGGPTNIR